jgi:hypothetical protein
VPKVHGFMTKNWWLIDDWNSSRSRQKELAAAFKKQRESSTG